MSTVFNWRRIHAHLDKFSQEERHEEFKRFTSVKENYTGEPAKLTEDICRKLELMKKQVVEG